MIDVKFLVDLKNTISYKATMGYKCFVNRFDIDIKKIEI